ncbi:hypothetical protein PV327_008412 [Microctonus hyperodae]|uniref:Uncharacterized protein n=1 Tax=Microctonus hyperodae TaxID=165561 RepID=A0AA39KH62_MICHY|nr:hypothetical protein PV327_008412 [Microctonus hyperodae]
MLTARSSPLGVGRGPRTLGPAEGSDHLFLLPERALIMDSTQLRQDLAGLDFNLHLNLLHTAPRGNVWLSTRAREVLRCPEKNHCVEMRTKVKGSTSSNPTPDGGDFHGTCFPPI